MIYIDLILPFINYHELIFMILSIFIISILQNQNELKLHWSSFFYFASFLLDLMDEMNDK